MAYIGGTTSTYTMQAQESTGPNTDEIVLYVRDNVEGKGVHVWINKNDARALAIQLIEAAK